jgi:ketosteroid isomerase-like protein
MSFLQMIRRLGIPISSCADFIRPIALALFTSAAVVFTWTTISSISAAPLEKEQDRVRIVAQIRSILNAQQDAWNRGDIDGFMNGYAHSRSTIFVSDDTVKRGWETVRDRYKKKYSDREKMGLLTFSDLEITPVSSNAAVALGRWKLKRAKDRPHGRFTLIFRKGADGWRIVHDHTSAAASDR